MYRRFADVVVIKPAKPRPFISCNERPRLNCTGMEKRMLLAQRSGKIHILHVYYVLSSRDVLTLAALQI